MNFVVVRVVDHKAEGLQSLDEAKSTIEQFLKREKADKVLAEKAEQAVKSAICRSNQITCRY